MSLAASAAPGPALAAQAPLPESRAERWLRHAAEWPACALVVAEVALLLTGIVARTVFQRPIIWTDELASILFLWLAMLGSVVAVQQDGHMRLTFVVTKLPSRARAWCDVLALGAVAVFLALLLRPALDYMDDQAMVETPALGWSGTVRALAMPVGCALALLSACARLVRQAPRNLLGVAALLGAVAAGAWLGQPLFAAIDNWSLVVFFVGLLGASVLAGVPIAFCFALATTAYLLATTSTPLTVVVGRMDEGMSGLILLAVPLVRAAGPVGRSNRHGAGDGGLPGLPARARARWHVLRAAGRHAAGVRHLWLQDRRHGGHRAGAVPGDAQARHG